MDRIGRYSVEGELGRGGCGIVYLARDEKINRQVAIKTILTRELRGSASGLELQTRLTREAQSGGSLNHPAIVTVYELAEENDLTFFVMEYVDGPPLDKIMAASPIAWPRLLQILREIASGLDFAHSKGIIHRDVKPANILISSAGHAKISDFGVAKILEQTSMTTTGMAVGTPAYMSPEQILTKPLDGRSDQFSLAIIAFELLTGRKPFAADSLPGLIHQILSCEPPDAATVNASIPAPAAAILTRALSKVATDRFGTCAEFVTALEGALQQPVSPPQDPLLKSTQTTANKKNYQPQGKSVNWLLGLPLIALGLGLGAYYATRNQQPQVATAVPAPAPSPAPSKPEPRTEPEPAKPVARQPIVVKESKPKPIEPAAPPPPSDPGPDQPAAAYMGSPEGRFTWTGSLPPGERLVIVRNRVRMGSIAGNGLPAGVAVQADARPADIRVMQSPAAGNGFRLIVVNQSDREVSSFTVLWREQGN
jgi:serine/threonine protein kinase